MILDIGILGASRIAEAAIFEALGKRPVEPATRAELLLAGGDADRAEEFAERPEQPPDQTGDEVDPEHPPGVRCGCRIMVLSGLVEEGVIHAGIRVELVPFPEPRQLRVELPDSVDATIGRKLVDQAHQVCPYSNATRGNIEVDLVVE